MQVVGYKPTEQLSLFSRQYLNRTGMIFMNTTQAVMTDMPENV
jgi:hypothetical protein